MTAGAGGFRFIRPLLVTNQQRTKKIHTVVFFTFLVANIGGCLTPLGDPPLFMGYLAGVPFEWTFRLVPQWAITVSFLLVVYFIFDTVMYMREPSAALEADRLQVRPTHIAGAWLNTPLLIGVILSVAFLTDKVVPFPTREGILIALAAASWFGTKRELRQANKFTFYPIIEVAALFAGIFATMIPAIIILKARGGDLGVDNPMNFFWATGTLSAFLDNTPTYVVFFALAQGLGLPPGGTEVAATGVDETVLMGISLGAVFMGAMTYIGNAPNFMVKSIAEESGIEMPSFFGYLFRWSMLFLVPVFVLVSFLYY